MQVSRFAVLPDVGPRTTVLVVLASIAPSLLHVWRNPDPKEFARAAAYSCMCRCRNPPTVQFYTNFPHKSCFCYGNCLFGLLLVPK